MRQAASLEPELVVSPKPVLAMFIRRASTIRINCLS